MARAGKVSLVGLVAVLAALLLLAAPGSARIVVQKSIAGVELEMVRSEVVEKKGEPDAERVVRAEIFGRQRVMRYGRTKLFFAGTRRQAPVVAVRTKDRRQKTRRGIGVGSRERAVKRNVAGVRCRSQFGTRHCFKGRFRAGERVTDFTLSKRGGRVTAVLVGIVID